MKKLSLWQKRVLVLNVIYDDIITNHVSDKNTVLRDIFSNEDFDSEQMKIIEHYFNHYQEVDELVIKLLKPTWTYQRINPLTKAIIQCAYHEFQTKEIAKAIVIDQALITCSRRGITRDKKFINAILDKILIKK
ncbi:MAG: DUF1948 domain-containing protein [Mycoplasma sp.]